MRIKDSIKKVTSIILAAIILQATIACQPEIATAPATPTAIKVQYSVGLQSWVKELNACAQTLPNAGLITTEVPASQIQLNQVDFALRFGSADLTENATDHSKTLQTTASTQPANFSVVLGEDEIVLVTNANVSPFVLTPQIVAEIYSGKITDWADLFGSQATVQPTPTSQPIQVWTYPEGDDLRQVFDAAFLPNSGEANHIYLAPDQSAMLEALQKDSHAIGFMLKSQVPASLQIISLTGEPKVSLTQPILAISQLEPQDLVRQMIVCLQSQ